MYSFALYIWAFNLIEIGIDNFRVWWDVEIQFKKNFLFIG